MLELEHINLLNETGQSVGKDISFSLPNFGMVAIHGNHSSFHHAMASFLAGIKVPESGTLIYNEKRMDSFDESQRASYRSTFVISLFHDFQILKNISLLDNITMGLEYPSERVDHLLKKWKLYAKKDVAIEDLNTKEQWVVALLRCVLRQPMMLVMDCESTPLSQYELEKLYPFLQELCDKMLIVIIGDQGSYPFCDRIIEVEDGYLLSDSTKQDKVYPQINHTRDNFELTRTNVEELQNNIQTFIRWKLRCASILCMIAFMALSTAVFSTSLNTIEIQQQLMKKQHSTLVAIEKQAKDKQGKEIENYYDSLKAQDIETIESKLKKKVILGYFPTDDTYAKQLTYGFNKVNPKNTLLDDFSILEANNAQELGLKKMFGTYPKNNHELALSSAQAYELVKDQLEEPFQNSESQIQKMLGLNVLWYDQSMSISAIFPSYEAGNNNLDMDMAGYNGNTYTSGTLMENSFFVKVGFHNAYPLLQSKVYQKSYKRMLSNARVISMMNGIYPLTEDGYYYDGKQYTLDKELKKDEILIDYPLALSMGFRPTFTQYTSLEEVNQKALRQEFEAFADQWINQTITIQTYAIEDAPNTTTLMSEKLKIKGFLFPWNFYDAKSYQDEEGQGAIYSNPSFVSSFETNNIYIKEAFYQSDSKDEMKTALTYFNSSKDYNAYLANSRILKFFVVDLKEITPFLMILGSSSLFVFLALLVYLLKESIKQVRSACTIYYLFGERKSSLQKIISQYFNRILWRRSLFGWFCASLTLAMFIGMIYFTLSSSLALLWAIVVPIVLGLICILTGKLAFSIVMKKRSVVDEEFEHY